MGKEAWLTSLKGGSKQHWEYFPGVRDWWHVPGQIQSHYESVTCLVSSPILKASVCGGCPDGLVVYTEHMEGRLLISLVHRSSEQEEPYSRSHSWGTSSKPGPNRRKLDRGLWDDAIMGWNWGHLARGKWILLAEETWRICGYRKDGSRGTMPRITWNFPFERFHSFPFALNLHWTRFPGALWHDGMQWYYANCRPKL